MKPSTGMFRPQRSTDWTRERVERLEPAEIRQLRDNASHLGIEKVAMLCDEVLMEARGQRVAPSGRSQKPFVRRKLLSRRNAFSALGVELADPVGSWSGVRKADGRVVIALWAAAIETRDGACRYLLWAPNVNGSRPWSDSPAGRERLEHCRLIGEQGKAEGLLVRGEALERYLPEEKARSVHGVDAEVVIVFTIERRGEEYWAVWGKRVPVPPGAAAD